MLIWKQSNGIFGKENIMQKKGHFWKVLSCILITVFFIPSAVVAGDKVYKMKAESVYGPMSKTTTEGLFRFLDLVEEKSQGKIRFQRFSSGSLAKAKEALDALEVGMFDVLLSYPSYYAGHVPEGQIFLIPYLFKSMKAIYDLWYNTEVGTMVSETFREKGSVILGPQFLASNVVATRKQISTLDGFKGLKIRAPGGVGSKTVETMGAVPVMLVGAEIYTALQRGTIDGYVYPLYSTWDYKFYEQAKFIVQPSLGYIITFIWMNKRTFDGLPSDLQKILMDAGKEHAAYLLDWAQKSDEKIWGQLATKGVKPVTLSEPDVNNLVENLKARVWPTYNQNARCKKILDICIKHEGWE